MIRGTGGRKGTKGQVMGRGLGKTGRIMLTAAKKKNRPTGKKKTRAWHI